MAAESPAAGEGKLQADEAWPPSVTRWPDLPAPGMAAPRPGTRPGLLTRMVGRCPDTSRFHAFGRGGIGTQL